MLTSSPGLTPGELFIRFILPVRENATHRWVSPKAVHLNHFRRKYRKFEIMNFNCRLANPLPFLRFSVSIVFVKFGLL